MMESSVSFFINKLIQHWDCSNKINSHFFSDLSKIIPLIMYYIPRYQLYNTLILKDIFTRKTDWNRSVLHKHFLNGYQNRIKSNWKWRVISIYTTSNHLPFSQTEGGGVWFQLLLQIHLYAPYEIHLIFKNNIYQYTQETFYNRKVTGNHNQIIVNVFFSHLHTLAHIQIFTKREGGAIHLIFSRENDRGYFR